MWISTVLLWSLIPVSRCASDLTFPPWFKFGSASSSYQVEGAWNIDGKAESKWDRLFHTLPGNFSNGNVACKSYFLWKRDLDMVAELGLEFYRFSISWPRLLPNGFANYINEDGKRYYNGIIDGLLERGIEPIVTIYHFEMPQILEDLGGWINPLISDWYVDYARVVFNLFGDRVKTWITINEPQLDCDFYYGSSLVMQPFLEHFVPSYICNKNILMAHAKAWRIYDEEFRNKYHGKIAITNHLMWLLPYSPEDEAMTEIGRQFMVGRYSHAIYSKEGGWPPAVEEIVEKVSRQLGYARTRLPPFTPEEIKVVQGTYDFYGMNHYTSRLVRPVRAFESVNSFVFSSVAEINGVFDYSPNWTIGYNQLLPMNPPGIREQMKWLKEKYGDIEILITENGFSTPGSNLNDDDRIDFIRAHLEQILLAINEGVNVTGYSYWSLMDSLEWFDGFKSKFGLYQVDFSDEERRRTKRKSATFYSNVIKTRSLFDHTSRVDDNKL